MATTRRTRSAIDPRTASTRAALVDAAVAALREVGFAGASARDIAGRAESTQSQVFYHFGTVYDLLLAALDQVSAHRLDAYQKLLDEASSPNDVLVVLQTVIETDLRTGDLRVLTEMIAGSATVPGLANRVYRRLGPWFTFAEEAITKVLRDSPLANLVPVADLASALVAGVLGLEMVASLGGHERITHLLAEASNLVELATLETKGSDHD